ncbi:arginine--tRNA ligase [Candidatus Falkowbacteria bacterium]|jgi:arginyl-tRNA synthetase|nr:arginine--tRNA ligase [Candidatus Falkowbacteria bacterium]
MPAILTSVKNKITRELKLKKASFSYPPNSDLGDLSLACFELAKENKKNPAALAGELAEKLKNSSRLKKYFSDIKAAGPYLNFYIKSEYLANKVIREIKKKGEKYGTNCSGRGRRIMIEFSNGNTHKEYHVGHLRNIAYGDAVNHLLNANGYKSIPVSFINDFGIFTAKTLWNWERNQKYKISSEPKGYLLGKCYSESSRLLDEHPEYKEEVSQIMKAIESRQGKYYDLWAETRKWSIDYFASIYQELEVKFEHTFYESEYTDAGLKLVNELLAAGQLVKSQGAIIANLEQYGLSVLPIIRTDGTALYPVADFALAQAKFKKYKIKESLYVIDVRQSLYFQQLAKIFELMGYRQKIKHLSYDFVTLPEGMMASRTGNVITYESLKNKIWEKLIIETKKRHEDWIDSRVEQAALSLAISTMKFEMLKVSADKIIVFDINNALRFDGFTACYLQYGYARLKSVIRKEPVKLFNWRVDLKELKEAREKGLLLKLAQYQEVVKLAGEKYNPSEVAKYLFELVQLSNDYYHEVPILKAGSKTRQARLSLIKAITQVLNNGFNLLGMPVIEEM